MRVIKFQMTTEVVPDILQHFGWADVTSSINVRKTSRFTRNAEVLLIREDCPLPDGEIGFGAFATLVINGVMEEYVFVDPDYEDAFQSLMDVPVRSGGTVGDWVLSPRTAPKDIPPRIGTMKRTAEVLDTRMLLRSQWQYVRPNDNECIRAKRKDGSLWVECLGNPSITNGEQWYVAHIGMACGWNDAEVLHAVGPDPKSALALLGYKQTLSGVSVHTWATRAEVAEFTFRWPTT